MKINNIRLETLFSFLEKQQLLDKEELQAVHDVAAENFPFAEQVAAAATVHFHIHVNNIEELPHELLQSHTGKIVNKAEGYIKYEFDDGINFIFSHIPVAQRKKLSAQEIMLILITLALISVPMKSLPTLSFSRYLLCLRNMITSLAAKAMVKKPLNVVICR